MQKNLYIDSSHPDETRVVLKSENHIEEYEYENKNKLHLKNNIYLGKVSRIEPSLQAAFVDFGRERHGFLSFNDIQSDYYQIPKSDLERIKQMKSTAMIINVARGGIINEEDLAVAVKEGIIAGAAIDVFQKEPYAGNLKNIERCLLTAHMGSMSVDCRKQMEIEATEEEELEMGGYDQIEEKNPEDYEELEKVTTEAVNEFFDGDIKWVKRERDDE